MKSDNKKSERDPSAKEEKDLKKGPGKDLNRDINKNSQNERFPESNMTKDSRKDAEKNRKKDDSDIETLVNDDLAGSTNARSTSTSADDIAGVADLDNGMKRADRR
jgi:hypothetical protein